MRFLAIILMLSFALPAHAREQIRIAGSSTVYPFVSVAAEEFGRQKQFRTPVVESTGTGGGFKLFCGGVGEGFIDIANASRPIKDSEIALCKKNGVTDIFEVKIGYDGIVLAGSRKGAPLSVTIPQLFLALAQKVPQNGALVENPYTRWNEIDKSLPDAPITVYGPPPTSGTRDSIIELVMEKGCKQFKEFDAAYRQADAHKKACALMREDGKFVEAGEDDNIIVQKLEANHEAYGLFGYSFYEENIDKALAAPINGQAPSVADIASGAYPVARSLYVYAKGEHVARIRGIKEFLSELVSEKAAGEEGYLTMRGLIPLLPKERSAQEAQVKAWHTMQAPNAKAAGVP